jgi:hypothetical protein
MLYYGDLELKDLNSLPITLEQAKELIDLFTSIDKWDLEEIQEIGLDKFIEDKLLSGGYTISGYNPLHSLPEDYELTLEDQENEEE